jgi:hypothetical protein
MDVRKRYGDLTRGDWFAQWDIGGQYRLGYAGPELVLLPCPMRDYDALAPIVAVEVAILNGFGEVFGFHAR